MDRCEDGAVTNFVAKRSCESLPARRYHGLPGRPFLWVARRIGLSRIFSSVGRCKYGAITNILAESSAWSLSGRSHHEFSGRAYLCVSVRTELSRIFCLGVAVRMCSLRIFLRSVPVSRYKDGALTNFLADRSCDSLCGRTIRVKS